MKACAFCGNTAKLTGEHVWSAWIGRLFPNTSEFETRLENVTPKTRDSRQWIASGADQKAKVVCKPCNEGWMSDLESQSKYMLSNLIRDGAPVSILATRGVALLAAYAFKCAVICNHMSVDGEPFFDSTIREEFRRSRRIPPDVRMWVAAYGGRHRFSGRFYAHYGGSPVDERTGVKVYVFTFGAGKLAFQLAAFRRPGLCIHDFDFHPEAHWSNAPI